MRALYGPQGPKILAIMALCWALLLWGGPALAEQSWQPAQGQSEVRIPLQAPAAEALSPVSPVPPVPLVWQPLVALLAADGIRGPQVDALFAALGDQATSDPMGRKVRELYVKSFLRSPPDPNAPRRPRLRLYKDVVTEENARRCREFLAQNTEAFAQAEARYGVPKEIAVALLFVETRLGTSLGKDNALYTLASMAVSTTPESIRPWWPKLPGYEQHLDWMQELMPKRATWAYKELRALVVHVLTQNIEPSTMPGSIYGAVGICQFMPSNLVPYGADGDSDGIVDLFTVPDAVASLSYYLARHGWKAGMGRAGQHAVLKTYNKIDIYANTIMALGDKIAGRSLPLPTDPPASRRDDRTKNKKQSPTP